MLNQIFLIAFLLVTLATFYHAQIGFSLVVACRLLIPAIVRVNFGIVELSLNSCLTAMLIAVIGVKVLLKQICIPRKEDNRVFVKPFLLFFSLITVLNIFGSSNSLAFRFTNELQFLYTEFLLGFTAWIIFNNSKDTRFFFRIVGITSFVISSYGIYCYVSQNNPYITIVNAIYQPVKDALSFMEEERAGLGGRIQGTMTHPLTWGGSCLILFFLFLTNNRILKRYFQFSLLVLLFLNVVFSGSRSALLALIVGLIVIVVLGELKIKRNFLIYSSIGLLTVLFTIYQVPSLIRYKEFFESTVFFWNEDASQNIKGSSVSMRLEQLEGAFTVIKSNPIAGLGQGYIKYYSSTFGIHPILKGFESIFFMALVESGIFGLITWCLFFYMLYVRIKRLNIPNGRFSDFDYVKLKGLLATYILFIIFTGIQSTFYLFLIAYVVSLKSVLGLYPEFIETNNSIDESNGSVIMNKPPIC